MLQRIATPVLFAVFLSFALVDSSAHAGGLRPCTGDCDGDGSISISEVITCVNIGLERQPSDTCPACDEDGDGVVTISEIITSVNIGLALIACATATPTVATPTVVPTSTPTPRSSNCPCDVSGEWTITVRQVSNNCGDPNTSETETVRVVQDDGCIVTIATGGFLGFRGEVVSDCRVEFDYDQPDEGGVSRNTGFLEVDGCSLQGESHFVFREDGFSCTGDQDVMGTREDCPQ